MTLARLSLGFAALVMALPMHWCCFVQAAEPPTAVATPAPEACAACRKFAEPAPAPDPAPSSSPHDCACCDQQTPRDLSPATVAAPRLVLVDLQAETRWRPVELLLPSAQERVIWSHRAQAPPRARGPLYERHCALLL